MRTFGTLMDYTFLVGFIAAVVWVCVHTWNMKGDIKDEE